MKKIAIISANGMGDLVLMAMLAYNAKQQNDVTLFHPHYEVYQKLFSHFRLDHPQAYEPHQFDLTIVENDHSQIAYQIQEMREKKPHIIFIFPKPSLFFRSGDFLFDPTINFIENLTLISKQLFGMAIKSHGIELNAPYRQNIKEDLLHPLSKSEKKIWPITKFKKIYSFLQEEGYNPKFVMTEKEKLSLHLGDYATLTTPTLYDLALRIRQTGYFIGCDSGPGHLASSLGIPTLTLFPNPKIGIIWRPSYHLNILATPPFKISRIGNSKYNLLDFLWHRMVTVHSVKQKFKKLVHEANV